MKAGLVSFESHATFRKAMPVLGSAIITLFFGGFVGVLFLAQLSGFTGFPSFLARLFGSHWFFMVFGFTNALISAEILTLLSMEWAKKTASTRTILAFLFFFWSSMITYVLLGGNIPFILTIMSFIVVFIHSYKTLVKRSWIGLPPTHYNYLLTITPIIMVVLVIYTFLTKYTSGLPKLSLPTASIILPVAAIIAVETRDIPLLLGVPPTKSLALKSRSLRTRAVLAYIVSIIGILLAATNNLLIAGILLVIGGLLALSSISLIEAIEKNSKGIPQHIKKHVTTHTIISYTWFIASGILLATQKLLNLNPQGIHDSFIHMLTLGFMFNVIMGIDAILLYGHAGIPLNKTPKPQPWPGILLNIGLLLRMIIDIGGITGITGLISGILIGIGILVFYLRNLRNIRKIMLNKEQTK